MLPTIALGARDAASNVAGEELRVRKARCAERLKLSDGEAREPAFFQAKPLPSHRR
jgi:hypothetical protein